jgi:hypothetical protein
MRDMRPAVGLSPGQGCGHRYRPQPGLLRQQGSRSAEVRRVRADRDIRHHQADGAREIFRSPVHCSRRIPLGAIPLAAAGYPSRLSIPPRSILFFVRPRRRHAPATHSWVGTISALNGKRWVSFAEKIIVESARYQCLSHAEPRYVTQVNLWHADCDSPWCCDVLAIAQDRAKGNGAN